VDLPVKERVQEAKVIVKEREKNADLLLLELVQKYKDIERATLDVARIIYELHGLGITDQAISDRLLQSGVSLSRSTVTTYRNLWQYYVAQLGLLEKIQGIPLPVLMTLRTYAMRAKLGRDQVEELLDQVRGMTTEQATAFIREHFGDEKRESEFATIKVERPIYEMLDRVRSKLNAISLATGGPEVSPTQVLEFALKLLEDADIEELKEVWLKEHGEWEDG